MAGHPDFGYGVVGAGLWGHVLFVGISNLLLRRLWLYLEDLVCNY